MLESKAAVTERAFAVGLRTLETTALRIALVVWSLQVHFLVCSQDHRLAKSADAALERMKFLIRFPMISKMKVNTHNQGYEKRILDVRSSDDLDMVLSLAVLLVICLYKLWLYNDLHSQDLRRSFPCSCNHKGLACFLGLQRIIPGRSFRCRGNNEGPVCLLGLE